MTIHLPPDLEKSLIAKVQGGVFSSLDAAMTQAAHLLLEQIEPPPAGPKAKDKRPKAAKTVVTHLTIEEFNRKLLAEGRISRLPDTAADFDDPADEPVEIKGEPLSETVIRERR